MSYLTTLRYQWQEGGFGSDSHLSGYLSGYYYQEEFDAHSIFQFSTARIWSLLTYHLPEVVVIAALPAFAILLVAAFIGKFRGKLQASAIVVLFSSCIAISAGAAVLAIYPLGGIRQNIYLGPVVFLAVGVVFHWTAGWLSSLTRRAWTMPALLVAIAGATLLAGAGAMRPHSPDKDPGYETFFAVLKEQVRGKDMVYVDKWALPAMRFYQGNAGQPANYHYNAFSKCRARLLLCLGHMADLASWLNVHGKIWVVVRSGLDIPKLSIEEVVSGGKFSVSVYLIEDTESLINLYASDIRSLPTTIWGTSGPGT